MGPFLTVGSEELGWSRGEVVDKPKKRVKREKQHRVLRPTASTSRTEQWFKDRPEDLRRGEMEEERKGRCNTLGETGSGVYWVRIGKRHPGMSAGTGGHGYTVTVW